MTFFIVYLEISRSRMIVESKHKGQNFSVSLV